MGAMSPLMTITYYIMCIVGYAGISSLCGYNIDTAQKDRDPLRRAL
jgi:hypothetical protein